MRSSHLAFKMHEVGYVRSSLPTLVHVGSIATPTYLKNGFNFSSKKLEYWYYFYNHMGYLHHLRLPPIRRRGDEGSAGRWQIRRVIL